MAQLRRLEDFGGAASAEHPAHRFDDFFWLSHGSPRSRPGSYLVTRPFLRATLRRVEPARTQVQHIDDSRKRPVISGTDIKVSQIASEVEHLGMTPDEIVEAHPHLTLADVYAALAYYYDHRDSVQQDWREAREYVASLRARYPSRFPAR